MYARGGGAGVAPTEQVVEQVESGAEVGTVCMRMRVCASEG